LANFINGELFGRASDVPWAMVFPLGGDEARHPSQLYEALLEGLLLFLLLRVLTHRYHCLARPGFISGAFAAGYGVARTFVEFFREPDIQIGYLSGGLTMGMLLSVPMIVAGVGVMIWSARRNPAAVNSA
jgi:phosphatidylglycerol:prolipoprotein diacylglycerol transferase